MDVIDANAVLYAFSKGPLRDIAREVMTRDDAWLAPDIFSGECANALARLVRVQKIRASTARTAMGHIQRFIAETIPTAPLVAKALDRALALNHGVFDCLYFEAARARNTRLVTADERFIAKLSGTPDSACIIHLADWRHGTHP